MGLLSALNSALSGLHVNQQNLNILSQNISNANTEGYSAQRLNQNAAFIDGQGQGVTIGSISRNVSEFFNSEIRINTSSNGSASVIKDYYDRVQTFLGKPGGTGSIDSKITDFFSAFQDLSDSPGVSSRAGAVNAGNNLALSVSGLATSLQNLRLQADNDISGAVNSVNLDLKSLRNINISLQRAAAAGQSNVGLLDQRDKLLNDLSQYIDINPSFQEDGGVFLSTNSGANLIGSGNYAELSYKAISSIQAFKDNVDIAPLQVTLLDDNGDPLNSPTNLATGNTTSDNITTSLQGGKIHGLLAVRDSIMPTILSQIDNLASNLRDSFNEISNSGVGFPPPNSYTGERLLSGASTSQYSGNIKIALLGSDGKPVASPYVDEPNGLQSVDINLSTLDSGNGAGVVSVDDLIQSINRRFGQAQNKVELGNLNNVGLGIVSGAIPDVGNVLKLDFNLNNISGSNADFYVGNVTILDSNGANVASTGAGSITTTQPSFALASSGTYQTVAGSDKVTVTAASATGLASGDVVYLNPPATAQNGVPAAMLGGYFTVSNVSGNSFEITAVGAGSYVSASGTSNASDVSAFSRYTSVGAGQTLRTGDSGVLTASLASNTTSPYYTVQANIATKDSSGNLVTSTVSYRVANNANNSRNTLIGADIASGSGKIVSPTSSGAILVARLVDANGNELSKSDGLYGNRQGYLQIKATDSKVGVAIDSLDSMQVYNVNKNLTTAGSGLGFSGYFGLNNFFKTNSQTSTGDSVQNSAINLVVNDKIKNNPALIATGKLTLSGQPSDTSAAPNYTYKISAGDNSVSSKLADLATSIASFAASKGMAASSTTFVQYAGQIISFAATSSKNAQITLSDSQALLDGFTKKAADVSGVNLDQELANTVIYQNSYSASARVITVVGKMFDDLIASIQ